MASRILTASLVISLPLLVPGGLAAGELDAAIGERLFRRNWTPAPSSTRANDGLGPIFNARSCAACHPRLERPVMSVGASGGLGGEGLVIRFSDKDGRPDPVYGSQLQTAAVPGVEPEGRPARQDNRVEPDALAYGSPTSGTRAGARLAPSLRGLGRLAAVAPETLAALADPEDRDGNGVSGRVNWLAGTDGTPRAGRFGWKASSASLADQIQIAFALDLGMSTSGRHSPAGDCTERQAACLAAPHGGDEENPEIADSLVRLIEAYLSEIAPPRAAEEDRQAAALFERTGCADCHRPMLPSPNGPVYAFTDLLLHDLGPGLDGGATEPGVLPTEWRTAPLWGLSQSVRSSAGLLHDGRARSIEEAVRWHGGEGTQSRDAFLALAPADKRRLIDYVAGL